MFFVFYWDLFPIGIILSIGRSILPDMFVFAARTLGTICEQISLLRRRHWLHCPRGVLEMTFVSLLCV